MKSSSGENHKNLEKLFIESYDQYAPNIYRHIYFRVNNKSVAEDLTSETFVKTWEYLRKGNEVKNLKSFLYKVANNLIVDHYRQRKPEVMNIEELEEKVGAEESNSVIQIDIREEIGFIKGHLEELPKEHQEILIYRFVDDLSIREIRELTGKSAANVYVIIHRAVKFLKKKIQNG